MAIEQRERSEFATKEEMQTTIDLLRVRGDTAIEILESVLAQLKPTLVTLEDAMSKLLQFDASIGIGTDDRRANAIIHARRMLGEKSKGMNDQEVLNALGGLNGDNRSNPK